jgi:phosphoglycerate dehydrogenase-like enzyme
LSTSEPGSKPKGLYVLNEDAFERIYGRPEQSDIAELVDIYAPPRTAGSVKEDPGLLAEAEVILSGWGAPLMDESFLAAAPKLEAVFYGAGSVRGFVTEALWERGVRVTSAYAANAVPVSEYTLAAILFSLKRGWHFSSAIKREGRYPPREEMPGAYGSTVGLVSLGMVGTLVRERLAPFDVRVVAYDPYVSEQEAARLVVEPWSLERLFRESDVVSLHTPLLEETRGMVTGDHIRSMKRGATFINTARGAIVKQGEMAEALAQRPDLWAVLDVTHPEPPEPGSPLYALPNVVLTPHIAGSMGAECRRMGRYMVEELRRYAAGEPLRWEITREKAALLA